LCVVTRDGYVGMLPHGIPFEAVGPLTVLLEGDERRHQLMQPLLVGCSHHPETRHRHPIE
jgi:hypothetical protein